jgi:hypothetical protein
MMEYTALIFLLKGSESMPGAFHAWFVDPVRSIKFVIDTDDLKVLYVCIDENSYKNTNKELKRIRTCYGDIRPEMQNQKTIERVCLNFIDFLQEKFKTQFEFQKVN